MKLKEAQDHLMALDSVARVSGSGVFSEAVARNRSILREVVAEEQRSCFSDEEREQFIKLKEEYDKKYREMNEEMGPKPDTPKEEVQKLASGVHKAMEKWKTEELPEFVELNEKWHDAWTEKVETFDVVLKKGLRKIKPTNVPDSLTAEDLEPLLFMIS